MGYFSYLVSAYLSMMLCWQFAQSARPLALKIASLHANDVLFKEFREREEILQRRSETLQNYLSHLSSSVSGTDARFTAAVNVATAYVGNLARLQVPMTRSDLLVSYTVKSEWRHSERVDPQVVAQLDAVIADILQLQDDQETLVSDKLSFGNKFANDMTVSALGEVSTDVTALTTIPKNGAELYLSPAQLKAGGLMPLAYMETVSLGLGPKFYLQGPDALDRDLLQSRHQTQFASDEERILVLALFVKDLQSHAKLRKTYIHPVNQVRENLVTVMTTMMKAHPSVVIPNKFPYAARQVGNWLGDFLIDSAMDFAVAVVGPYSRRMMPHAMRKRHTLSAYRAQYGWIMEGREKFEECVWNSAQLVDEELSRRETEMLQEWRSLMESAPNSMSPETFQVVWSVLTVLETDAKTGFVNTNFDALLQKLQRAV